jgi:ribosomal protein S18 acetylase RimI-like enzyme
MRFVLDKILIDEILFYMEDQDGDFLLDTKEVKIINNDNFDDEPEFEALDSSDDEVNIKEDTDRYINLPEWDSNDGFRLMEKFTSQLKNPILRHELSAALNTKRGVFRSFKNVLEHYPEAEKMWYKFKEQKMKEEVILWYNSLREEWGLEPIGSELSEISEDISAIILEDFIFRNGEEKDAPEVSALHKLCVEELNENTKACVKESNKPCDIFIAAETASADFCGYICAFKDGEYLQITRLEVKPEYRGMGIGKTLLTKLLSKLPEKAEGKGVIFDLPAEFEYFSRTLHVENFKPGMQRFLRSN